MSTNENKPDEGGIGSQIVNGLVGGAIGLGVGAGIGIGLQYGLDALAGASKEAGDGLAEVGKKVVGSENLAQESELAKQAGEAAVEPGKVAFIDEQGKLAAEKLGVSFESVIKTDANGITAQEFQKAMQGRDGNYGHLMSEAIRRTADSVQGDIRFDGFGDGYTDRLAFKLNLVGSSSEKIDAARAIAAQLDTRGLDTSPKVVEAGEAARQAAERVFWTQKFTPKLGIIGGTTGLGAGVIAGLVGNNKTHADRVMESRQNQPGMGIEP